MRVERRASSRQLRAHAQIALYGVVSVASGEVLEVFAMRREADELVNTWNADEPDEVGALDVVELAILYSLN
jgi:hypothetical protein